MIKCPKCGKDMVLAWQQPDLLGGTLYCYSCVCGKELIVRKDSR